MLKRLSAIFVGFSFIQFVSLIFPFKIRSNNQPKTKFEPVDFITSDGLKLAGWWVPGIGDATIIVGHGYPFDKGNIYQGTNWLHPQFNLLFYDHRSFGESEGMYTTGGIEETKDIEAAIEFVKKKKSGSIGLYGFSLSAAAMLMSDHTHVNAVVADSSYATLKDLVLHIYAPMGPLQVPFAIASKFYGRFFLKNLDSSPLQSIAQTKTPIFLIHSKDDTEIPVESAYKLRRAANQETTQVSIIEGVDHGGSLASPRIRKRVYSFFAKYLL